ncbi:MAG: hypothetical protein V7711_05870 [Pseudomonadales bacterium]
MKHRLSPALFTTLLMVCMLFLMPATAYAKSTSDPNHQGWSGKYPTLTQVDWKPVETKCKQCTKMMDQYNATVQGLLESRYWLHYWRETNKAREKGKAEPLWPGKGDISDFETLAVTANLELFELQAAQLELHRKNVTLLEQQASYLQGAVAQCERTACADSKPSKMKAVKIGGESTKQPYQPDTKAILTQYNIPWTGPYSTNCLPCADYVKQLNALPGWVVRAHMTLQMLEAQLRYAEMIEKANKVKLSYLQYKHPDKSDYSGLKSQVEKTKQEIATYARYFETLLAQLATCEQKYCPAKKIGSLIEAPIKEYALAGDYGIRQCQPFDATQTINVGPNGSVGSGAEFKEDATGKLVGFAAGALGFGGGGGSSKPAGPPTFKDPIKKKHKTETELDDGVYELLTGTVFTPDGLMVSNYIDDAIGKGTFQQVYLMNPRGWRLEPIDLFLFKIWGEWELSVSWTKDTYVDGQHTSHQEGGWTESWIEDIAEGVIRGLQEVPIEPIWGQLGFNTASSGARSVGTVYPVSPEMLRAEPLDLVVHITNPKNDPVDTKPVILRLSLGDDGKVKIEYTGKTQARELADNGNLLDSIPCSNDLDEAEAPAPEEPADQPTTEEPTDSPSTTRTNTTTVPDSTKTATAAAGGATATKTATQPTLEELVEKQSAQEQADLQKSYDEDSTPYCGPDATKGFLEALALIAARMEELSSEEKGQFDGLVFMLANGQEMDYFPDHRAWPGDFRQCPSKQCKRKDRCYTLFGRCVARHVLSDTMYGFVVGMVGLGNLEAKAGGAYAEFNKAGGFGGVSAALESIDEDVLGLPSSQKENPASVGAYRFGMSIADAVEDGRINTDDGTTSVLEGLNVGDVVDPGDTIPAFDKHLAPALDTAYAHLKPCKDCPNSTPIYSYGFTQGIFDGNKDFSRAAWKLEGDKYQVINEAFLFTDPYTDKERVLESGSDDDGNYYEVTESKLDDLDITIENKTPTRSWTKYYTEKGIELPAD